MADYARLGTHNMVLPAEGPKVFPFTLDFRVDNNERLDFTLPIQQSFVSFIQALYIDNSLNLNVLYIQTDQVNQSVPFPPKSAGYLPLFISDSAKLSFTTTVAANLTVQVIATNTPVTPYIWSIP